MQEYGDSMGVMDIFYNTKVDIYHEENGVVNDLGIVTTILSPFAEGLKAVKNPLTVQQMQQRYGLDVDASMEFTVEYNEAVELALVNNQLLILVCDGVFYKVESGIVYDKFYVLDASINLAVTRHDEYNHSYSLR